MECRLPGKREEIKHNPETTDATETVCSWRTLVWRQAACSQNYLRGRIKTFCHLTYLSPTLHRKFPEFQSHYIVASSSSTSKSILGSLKQVWPSSLNAQFWILVPNPLVVFFFFCSRISLRFSHDLNAWNRLGSLKKGFLARADLIFGKSQKSHEPSRVSIVDVPSTGCHCHQGTSVC